jgi:transposase-like protein
VLWELSVTEQRYRAVLEVLAGVPVTEVAGRYGVSRQSVHTARTNCAATWSGSPSCSAAATASTSSAHDRPVIRAGGNPLAPGRQ